MVGIGASRDCFGVLIPFNDGAEEPDLVQQPTVPCQTVAPSLGPEGTILLLEQSHGGPKSFARPSNLVRPATQQMAGCSLAFLHLSPWCCTDSKLHRRVSKIRGTTLPLSKQAHLCGKQHSLSSSANFHREACVLQRSDYPRGSGTQSTSSDSIHTSPCAEGLVLVAKLADL